MKKIIYLLLIILFYSTAKGQWLPDIWFNNSNGYNSFSRNVAAGNNIVHVVWHDYRLSTWEIYYKRSIDNGLNWGSDTRLTFNAGQSDNPSIFANGLNVYLVWHDNSNGYFEIYFKKSTDGGISWSSDLRISNSNYNTVNLHPSLFVSGSFIHVVWHDLRDGNREIYYNRSIDSGINWGTDTRLTNNSAESEIATISGSGSTVNVSWRDNRDGNFEIYQKLSSNNGINWSSDYRLTNHPGVSQSPIISASGSNASIVWEDNRLGNSQIFYNKSTDGGLHWGNELEFTTSSVNSVRPSIITSGSKIHVTWYEENTHRIFYKYSSNSGISWNPNTYLTTTASGICHCTGPSITAAEHAVHIVWTDFRQIYYKGNQIQNSNFTNIVSPNGRETFLSGSIQNITWVTNFSENIKLELTTNYGSSWSIITSNYPADSGRYSWEVPNVSSTQCMTKISDANNPSIYDISDSNFTISPVTVNTGLMAYYPFNGNANDESGNNYHGTNFGATLTTDVKGIQNKSYYFNGVNNYISVPDIDFENLESISWHALVFPERLNIQLALYYGYYGQIDIFTDGNNKIGVGISLDNQIWYDVRSDISSNRWYDVTAVWKKGNYLRLFVNGILVGQNTSLPDLFIGPRPLNHSSIGAYNRFEVDPRPYNGKVDEIRVYSRELTSSEIQTLFLESTSINITSPIGGEINYSGSNSNIMWTSLGINSVKIELTTNNGNSWSTISSNYPADSESYSWTVPNVSSTQCKIKITDTNDPGIYDISDSGFTITAVTLNTGLVVHYPFDNNFNDASGNGFNATPNGNPTFNEGVIGNSVNLIGDQNSCTYYSGGDRIRTPIFDFLSMNSFTISFWVYDTQILCGAETYFFQGDDWSPNRYIGIWHFYENIGFSVGSYSQQQNQNFFVPFRETDRNRFVLYTMTYSNGMLKAYRDSEYLGSFNQTVGYSSHYSGLASHGWFSGGASSARFVGKMDDFRIYNRELSQSEIQQLFNMAAPITQPSISISPIQINPGGSVSITGQNFRANSQVKVNVISSNAEIVFDQTLTASPNGEFNTNYASTVNSVPGIYTVSAYDVQTNQTAPSKSFEVKEFNSFLLTLTSPVSDSLDRIINVEWKDKMIPGIYPINNVRRYYKYKVNYTTDNGNTWSSDLLTEGYEYINSFQVFSAILNLPTFESTNSNTSVKVRVTDYLDPLRYSESDFIPVRNSELTKSKAELKWDYSYQQPSISPKGVCADGISRIYLKVSKVNPLLSITSVSIQLKDDIVGNTNLHYLGKLKVATVTDRYSDEAFNASSINITNSNQTDYWFWYVSPDDFVRAGNGDENKSERTVSAKISVNYSDGTAEYGNLDIIIVRPPLMLIHGIGSAGSLWNEYVNRLNNLFKIVKSPSYNSSFGFQDIGSSLMNWNKPFPYNPGCFQTHITEIRNLGYASNQVYYVCHSMGGNIARAASEYPYYKSNLNYNHGYINRLLTLDTPHNGSPLADFFITILPLLNNLEQFYRYGDVVKYAIKTLIKLRTFSLLNSTLTLENNSIFGDIIPTQSLKDLQIGNDGYKFKTTPISSFLFAGDFFPGQNIIYLNDELRFNGNEELDRFYEFLEQVIQVTLYPQFISSFYNQQDINYAISLVRNARVSMSEKVTKLFELIINKLFNSNSSIFNSDLVVSVNSQLANTQRTSLNTFDAFNGNHSSIIGVAHTGLNPCTNDTLMREKVKNLLNLPTTYNEFIQNIPPTPENNLLNQISLSNFTHFDNFDTSRTLSISSPIVGQICKVDSILNVSINVSDTVNLQYVSVSFQGNQYYDTLRTFSHNFAIQVTGNELDSSVIFANAIYIDNGNLFSASDLKIVFVSTTDSPVDFKIENDFNSVMVNTVVYPDCKSIYPNFINTGITGDITASVENPSIISFDNTNKTFKALATGETFAVVSNRGQSDTMYFVVNGELLIPETTFLNSPQDSGLISSTNLKFNWNNADYASYYKFQISKDADFGSVNFESNNLSDTNIVIPSVEDSLTYYWRVRAENSAGLGNWSAVRSFTAVPIRESYLYINLIQQGFYDSNTNKLNRKDTVRAYLVNVNPPYNIIDSSVSQIDSVSFQGLFKFMNAPTGTYYLKVNHLNSIETWSKAGGEYLINHDKMYYDFTKLQSQAFGDNLVQVNSFWCIYSGDVNQDGTVDATDLSQVDNDATNFISGYVTTDLTGDGFVDGTDFVIADNNAANFVSLIRP